MYPVGIWALVPSVTPLSPKMTGANYFCPDTVFMGQVSKRVSQPIDALDLLISISSDFVRIVNSLIGSPGSNLDA